MARQITEKLETIYNWESENPAQMVLTVISLKEKYKNYTNLNFVEEYATDYNADWENNQNKIKTYVLYGDRDETPEEAKERKKNERRLKERRKSDEVKAKERLEKLSQKRVEKERQQYLKLKEKFEKEKV